VSAAAAREVEGEEAEEITASRKAISLVAGISL
jgi:hypothetical protein